MFLKMQKYFTIFKKLINDKSLLWRTYAIIFNNHVDQPNFKKLILTELIFNFGAEYQIPRNLSLRLKQPHANLTSAGRTHRHPYVAPVTIATGS